MEVKNHVLGPFLQEVLLTTAGQSRHSTQANCAAGTSTPVTATKPTTATNPPYTLSTTTRAPRHSFPTTAAADRSYALAMAKRQRRLHALRATCDHGHRARVRAQAGQVRHPAVAAPDRVLPDDAGVCVYAGGWGGIMEVINRAVSRYIQDVLLTTAGQSRHSTQANRAAGTSTPVTATKPTTSTKPTHTLQTTPRAPRHSFPTAAAGR